MDNNSLTGMYFIITNFDNYSSFEEHNAKNIFSEFSVIA
jgi:hypothetical protein